MTYYNALRVAINQCVVLTLLSYVFFTLGSTLTDQDNLSYKISRNSCFVLGGINLLPLIFSAFLLFSVLYKKLILIRIWILSSILNTVIFFCLFESEAIAAAKHIEVCWSMIFIVLPIIMTCWMTDNIIVVLEFYKKQEQATKQVEIQKSMCYTISNA